MPERLFLFVQFEFPWPLGPPDGRYLLRSDGAGEPQQVVVLGTLGGRLGASAARAGRRSEQLRRRPGWRRRALAPQPEPARLPMSRATVVDPVSLPAERQARAWLAEFDAARDVPGALAVVNRVLHAQRIAAADPYTHEVSAIQAATIRAGWGEGEQVAEGHWLHAVEVPARAVVARPGAGRRRIGDRSAALRPHERLARLLGAREQPMLCEELALRTRLDLDQGRLAHAALELDRAYAAALVELAAESRGDMPVRVAELGTLAEGVARGARAALADTAAGEATAGGSSSGRPQVDAEAIRHALARLEAALRARTAAGFDRG